MEKIRILFIHHATSWGGASNSMIKLINYLDKERYDATVLLIKNSLVAKKLEDNNINYTIADSWFYKRLYKYFNHNYVSGYIKWYMVCRFLWHSILWLLSRYYYANKELLRHGFDIVHLNSSVLTDWLAPANRYGKVIIHIREPIRRGNYDIFYSFFRSQMQKFADKIIAISNDNAKRINLPEKTEVIYNYSEITEKTPPESSYKSKKILYLGGESLVKGYYTMVDVLDYLDEDLKIYFGGNYSSNTKKHGIKDSLKKIAKFFLRRKQLASIRKLNNHPNAIVIGLTHKVNDYLNEVCCLVSPFSVPHFARPVIEAFLQKKPVIGSDVEGMDEIIEHGVTGLIVPKNDPKALAKAINELACNSQLAKQLGEAGYSFAIKKFTPKNVQHVEKIYNQLISRDK